MSGRRDVSDALIPGKEPRYMFDRTLDGDGSEESWPAPAIYVPSNIRQIKIYPKVVDCNKPCSLLYAAVCYEELLLLESDEHVLEVRVCVAASNIR